MLPLSFCFDVTVDRPYGKALVHPESFQASHGQGIVGLMLKYSPNPEDELNLQCNFRVDSSLLFHLAQESIKLDYLVSNLESGGCKTLLKRWESHSCEAR